MSKFTFYFVLLIPLLLSELIQPNTDQCECEQISSVFDCDASSKCAWTYQPTKNNYECLQSTEVTPKTIKIPTYCSSIAYPAQNCNKTIGCAYVNKQCTHYTGCTAYVYDTHDDCQSINTQCITDGKQCINAKSCKEYLNESDCKVNPSISGNKFCVWDENACRDYQCTEAPNNLTTDEKCSQWLPGCITTGRGCIDKLKTCNSYQVDKEFCSYLIGLDGKCEVAEKDTACKAKTCDGAPKSITTDKQCEAYQIGCITNGKGCVDSPLPSCSSYNSESGCQGYIGFDGICDNSTDADSGYCIARSCQSASTQYNTDEQCAEYQKGCVTTGKGCATFRGPCSSYTGTSYTCIGYIGSDGNCYGTNSTLEQICQPKLCSSAPSSINTNSECNSYSFGCITTGRGCTAKLGLCSTYTGTTVTCEGYFGIDGNCKGTSPDKNEPCSPRICEEAPNYLTTNEGCTKYQVGCLTTGAGCVKENSCANTGAEITCLGTSDCEWNGICVDSSQCSDFQSISICQGNKAQGNPCFWTGTSCRQLTCSDAPIIYNSDVQCSKFLLGCVSKGAGCLSLDASCSLYQGTLETCSKFTRKCWNSSTATETSPCVERLCSDDTTSTTDRACSYFKTGCKTKGIGCIESSSPCTSHYGTQSQCATFTGENGKWRCWNSPLATSTTPCQNKACSDNTVALTDAECEYFLSGCVTNGSGCINKSLPCTSYYTEQKYCQTFSGNDGTKACWQSKNEGFGSCIEKVCAHAPNTLKTHSACDAFLSGCVFDGFACRPSSLGCSTYQGTYDQCLAYIGNGKQCFKQDNCVDRACSDKSIVNNESECVSYLSTCRYFKGGCVEVSPCDQYAGTSLWNCYNVTDNSSPPKKCWWVSGIACTSRTCANAPTTVSSQNECDDHTPGCIYNGASECVNKGTCDSYEAKGIDDDTKLNNCKQMKDINGINCWHIASQTKCVARACSNVPNPDRGQFNCSAHLSYCQFNGEVCVNQGNCNTYQVTGTDEEKFKKCQQMINMVNKKCYWRSGYYCEDISCENANVPVNQDSCDNHLKNLCLFQVESSVKRCISKTCDNIPNAYTNLDCQNWLPNCVFNGEKCVIKGECKTYKPNGKGNAEKRSVCTALINLIGTNCVYVDDAENCEDKTCANVYPIPATADSCATWMTKCRWIDSKCIEALPCNNINAVGINDSTKLTYCQSIKDNTLQLCTYHLTTSATLCSTRTCANIPNTPNSQNDCFTHLSTCRITNTNPAICIDKAIACSGYTGTVTQCKAFRGTNDTKPCWSVSTKSTAEPCVEKACIHNTTSRTDSECEEFLSGCKTNGAGCVDGNTPCSKFIGTSQTCQLRKAANGTDYCKVAQTVSGDCRDKQCQDDEVSNTDDLCKAFMPQCLTNGKGCILNTEPCSSYKGTQHQCMAFTGSSGAKPCWNIESATYATPCIEKQCIHNKTAKTDAECDKFLPKQSGSTIPQCVTDGFGCVSYPRTCFEFSGTNEECGTFTASDGPCQSSTPYITSRCIPKVCQEAPNTFVTDAQCKAFHSSCVSNGFGCARTVTCNDIQGKESCQSKSNCSWVNNCRRISSDCSNYSVYGASVCANTPVTTGSKRCAWYNNSCRAATCQDLSDEFTTHQACYSALPGCTTSGQGCIDMGVCDSYSTEQICKVANTYAAGQTCIWDKTTCRAKRCSDATTKTNTNEGCQDFLWICRTNGKTCISSEYKCSDLITSTACQRDASEKPCLWVNEQCYNYTKCEDVILTTYQACQEFSPLCTTNGTNCVPITSCANTKIKVSCIKGTDGTCGWLPEGKCKKFDVCSDAESGDKSVCQDYGPQCITDGTKCIEKTTCDNYTTQIACESGGTDGICIYSSNSCRLRKCQDATLSMTTSITTYGGCFSFSANGQCTTNGTICIPISTCRSYTVEAGCVVGTDGNCIWAENVGSDSTKSCRQRECQDFSLTSSISCLKLQGQTRTSCVSDGKKCIVKQACALYTTKESCQGGGTDGLCVFQPDTVNSDTGFCQLMTKCSDANNDMTACTAKSDACKWVVLNTDAIYKTSCEAHDCASKATGTNCNPVISFDGQSYLICVLTSSGCVEGDGKKLTQDKCYKNTLGTYTWNYNQNKCTACFSKQNDSPQVPNVSNDDKNSNFGGIMCAIIVLLVIG